MFARFVRWLCFVVVVGHLVAAVAVAKERKIFILTDLEGVSGVFEFAQTRSPHTPLNREAREYFMGDLTAVIRGLRDGGATEVYVFDGHGSKAVVPHLMAPGAKYATGHAPSFMGDLDASYAGLVLFGHHAMMGTPDGVLNHTQSSKSENRYWYNGVESGELAQVAGYAGHYNVPPIMATGDEATCREARKFFREPCVTVAVKRGLSRESAVLYPFAETHKALYEGAKRAMAVLPNCKPYKIAEPIQAKMQYLQFEKEGAEPKLITKEGTINSVLDIFKF